MGAEVINVGWNGGYMASKNTYFFEVKLFHQNQEVEYSRIKEVLSNIIEQRTVLFDNYRSLDVTPYDEEMHLVMDIYNYAENFLFARMSKQKPSNSMVQHDYRTFEKEDVLPGNNENERGIEQYTYGMLMYETGIFMLASTQGAPTEKIVSNIFSLYAPEYSVELTAIPNERAIESIYEGNESQITKLEIEVPLPNLGTLESVFNWNEDELLEVIGERNLNATIVLKPLTRKSITENEEETRKLVDIIKGGLTGYNKAKMKAKAQNMKLREYNFFDDKFSYPIDINISYIRDQEVIYYTVEQLVDIYRTKMRNAYYENVALLRMITYRN